VCRSTLYRVASSVRGVLQESAADHLLLFVCALIPKAMASLLTSTILELSRSDNVSSQSGGSGGWDSGGVVESSGVMGVTILGKGDHLKSIHTKSSEVCASFLTAACDGSSWCFLFFKLVL